MTSVRVNVVVNILGKAVSALVSIVLVPVYIRYLGIESYGLVGIFTLLNSLFGVLDFGVTPTVNRELARLSTRAEAAQLSRDLVRTLETFYWAIGILIGAIVVAAAPLIAQKWVKPQALSTDTVRTSIVLMGFVILLQWPFSLYEGGLTGLQRFVLSNSIQAGVQIVRGIGALLVLRFVSRTIIAFFVWQLIISGVAAALAAAALWKSMPRAGAAKYSTETLRGLWRFAWELTLISILSIALTQADKIILSRRLALTDFGYYNLAGVAASALYYLMYPIAGAVFPRLAQFFETKNEDALVRTYHSGCQMMTACIAPLALTVAFFSTEVMTLWTRSATTASHTARLVTILMLATMFNGFMNVPYMLQLASGWTRLALNTNAVIVVVQIPLLLLLTSRYGALGAAIVFLLLNSVYLFGTVNLMYARLLTRERWRWYLYDIALPLLAVTTVVAGARLFFPALPPSAVIPALIVVAGSAFGAGVAAAPEGRRAVVETLQSVQRRLA